VRDLGDMVTAKWVMDWDIPDPAQGGIAEYRKIRQMTADKIRDQLRQLPTRQTEAERERRRSRS